MPSGYAAVRAEINATLEGPDLNLRRIKRGIADLAGNPNSNAGKALFQDGYLIRPTSMAIGPYMQLLSTERAFGFEIYTGLTIGADYDESFDILLERVEIIIQKFHDCNANIPSAKIVTLAAPVTFTAVQETPDQVYALMPYSCVYRMD